MENINTNSEFGLKNFFVEIYKVKYIFIVAVVLVAISSFFLSALIPNYYKSESILFPRTDSEEEQGGGSLPNISSVVGINLGGESLTKVDIAIQLLQSRQFVNGFIEKHDILVDLFAVEGWDMASETSIYDDSIYDVNTEEWVREVDFPKTTVPGDWEAYEEFTDIVQVEEDSLGFVVLSVEFRSPVLAKEWLELIIQEINGEMKIRDQNNLERSLDFLYEKSNDTNNSNIRDIFYRLIENQTRKMMLTESNEEYVLEILDPPVVSIIPVWPNRLLIVVLSVLVTLILGVFSVLVKISIRQETASG